MEQKVSHRLKESYKGFVLEATAFPLPDSKFTVHLVIRKDERGYVDETVFDSPQAFSDVNTALRAGIAAGRKRVDSDFAKSDEKGS